MSLPKCPRIPEGRVVKIQSKLLSIPSWKDTTVTDEVEQAAAPEAKTEPKEVYIPSFKELHNHRLI